MGSIKSIAAALSVTALLVAACAAEQQGSPSPDQPGTSPGIDQPTDPTPAEQPGGPAGPAEGSPGTGTGASPDLGTGASPDTGMASPDTGASPDVGASPDTAASPGTEPSPAATGDPGEAAVDAVAVVDVAGSLTVLANGQCQLTQPDGATDGAFGQPADGSTLQLAFTDEAGQPTLDVSIELSRGFPEPEPTESPSPDLSPSPELSPSPAASPTGSPGPPLISGEDILPFTVLPEQVQLTVPLPDQETASQPTVLAGSVAPNGVNGYLIAQTETGELLTINFVCAQPEGETREPGASPDASPATSPATSPGIDESPAVAPSPSP